MIKKLVSVFAAAVLLLPLGKTQKAEAISFRPKENIRSDSAVMYQVDSYQDDKYVKIYEKNPGGKQMPGPLTDIMTAVVCLENCGDIGTELVLEPSVYQSVYDKISENDYYDDLPQMDILDGDKLTINDMLYCMMMTSSIECAQTLACYTGKQIEAKKTGAAADTISDDKAIAAFVQAMNDKAAELGMNNTHFTNAHGMYDDKQYTTAEDMGILSLYAMKNTRFETASTTFSYMPSVPNPQNHPNQLNWLWTHSNVMMDQNDTEFYYVGALGIKTAYLTAAGRNIVTSLNLNGKKFLLVLMRAPLNDAKGDAHYYHIEDAETLFDWAYSNISQKVVLEDSAEVGELPVTLADGNDYVLARPKEDIEIVWDKDVDTSLIKKDNIVWYKDSLRAPVKAGEPLGELTIEYEGEVLGKVELVAVSDVERSKLKYNIEVVKHFKDSKWFKTAFKIAALLCTLYIIMCIYALVIFKSKAKPLKPIYAVPKLDKKKKKKKD